MTLDSTDSMEVKLIENFSFEMIIVTLVRSFTTVCLFKMINFLSLNNVISLSASFTKWSNTLKQFVGSLAGFYLCDWHLKGKIHQRQVIVTSHSQSW